MPGKITVQLATLVKKAPEGDSWLHEIKLDGYRMICRIEHGKARLISRNQNDWTPKFHKVAAAAAALPVKTAILDGELVALTKDGRSSFQMLQNSFRGITRPPLIYFVFDLLYLNGQNTDRLPIEERKALLKKLIGRRKGIIRFSEHILGDGPTCYKNACKMHLEGIVSKRRGQPYKSGRGTDWLKVKCSLRAEFVIGGFTRPTGNRNHFGALLVGYHSKGKLIYAGGVGTGFSERMLASLRKEMEKLRIEKCPFAKPSANLAPANKAIWVRPKLVAEVEFSEWTDEMIMRHPSFQGLREDKPASEVVLDKPKS